MIKWMQFYITLQFPIKLVIQNKQLCYVCSKENVTTQTRNYISLKGIFFFMEMME